MFSGKTREIWLSNFVDCYGLGLEQGYGIIHFYNNFHPFTLTLYLPLLKCALSLSAIRAQWGPEVLAFKIIKAYLKLWSNHLKVSYFSIHKSHFVNRKRKAKLLIKVVLSKVLEKYFLSMTRYIKWLFWKFGNMNSTECKLCHVHWTWVV